MPETPSMARSRPTEVRNLRDEGLLRVTWSDRHVSEYPHAYLRGWCPCAGCQGHGNAPRLLHTPNARLESIRVVGNYALLFTWVDGHDTGIYSYTYLRERCPCAECAGDGAGAT